MSESMTCRQGLRFLMDYTENLLPPGLRRDVESHVGGCRRCQGFVRSYGETPRIVREATDTGMPVRVARGLRRALSGLSRREGERRR